MSVLATMIDEINAVSTGEQGAELVKNWVSIPSAVTPDASSGTYGTRNCSLIAEFVARRFTNRRVAWGNAMSAMGKDTPLINSSTTTLPFTKDGVLYLASSVFPSHELCLVRDSNYTALLHAWAGYWEIFPRLQSGPTYNVHGPDSDGEARVLKALTAGQPIRGTGPAMPKSWKYVVL
jgi:hypothetical protein